MVGEGDASEKAPSAGEGDALDKALSPTEYWDDCRCTWRDNPAEMVARVFARMSRKVRSSECSIRTMTSLSRS